MITAALSRKHIARPMSKEALAAIQRYVDDRSSSGLPRYTREEIVASRIRTLVHRAIKHYNSNNNKGAEFEYPDQSTTEMKAACVGFRGTFWYHLAFSARRLRDATERHQFFAELYFDRHSHQLAVETCIILEKPLCQFSSRCAFCPAESNILHPSNAEFVCGKEGHQKEFFHVRDMLVRPFNSCAELLYRSDIQWLDPTKTALVRRFLFKDVAFEELFL
ncbi:uncharacterized protein LOC119368172 [Triticum dicoccoides]|uniref:uncharacterized protein LOC119368172 n=1 Tax=Triticum dicoccoides TaxID=85692 RepID=UPI0008427C4B|nr:uncharacterized protein LOC119368172 [Triticum dicoccoides]